MACIGLKVERFWLFSTPSMDTSHLCLRDKKMSYHRYVGAQTLWQILKTIFIMVNHVYQPKENNIDT